MEISQEDDLEMISENGATSEEWVKESISNLTETSTPNSDEITATNYSPKASRRTNTNNDTISFNRAERWINLLGVRNKPNQLADWDNLYNLRNQTILRKDCQELLKEIGQPSEWTVPVIESLMTLYCKRRQSIEYESDKGWLKILGKLLLLPFNQCNLFNVFWAITTKYIPRSSKMYDLFRLLLQYHDPHLCSFMDSFKIQPYEYTNEWLCTLLSTDMSTELCYKLWDRYFEKGDPFLIFFVALAFVQSVKEDLIKLKDSHDIIGLLKDVPRKMAFDDIHDLLEICYVHLNLTPISVREDFHCMLFGSNLLDDCSELPLNRLICLPISVQELYRRAIDLKPTVPATFSYFVIDTRTQKCFNAGSIAGSYNLNATTIVEDPKKFGYAMNTLMEFKEANCAKDHICFLGSGREEEDQFMMMAIAKFLHKNYEHISYAQGGYKALHNVLLETGNLQKLSNHFNKNECIECKMSEKAISKKRISIFERLKKSIPIQTSKPEKNNKIPREKTPESSKERKAEDVKHVNSKDRGRRYRNVQSVFSLNEDSLSSDVDDLNMNEIEPAIKRCEKLRWADIIKKDEIREHFEGEEVILPEKEQISCYVALSRTHMHIFHKVPNEPGFAYPSLRHPLANILRVTSKRRMPEYLTFKFGYELPTGETHVSRVHYFILTKAGECATAVKLAILALKPMTIDEEDKEANS